MPDADARRHSEALCAHIAAEIAKAGGAIPFERYMELALYAPGLGYYSAGAQKFGAAGDFITAPEAAPVFGRVIARQCAEILDAAGGDTLLELGAGSGTLAAGILNEFARLDRAPPRYLILEPSPDLQARQRERLKESLPAEAFARVEWLDRLPRAFAGVIVANEVLDALPVARFEATADGVREMGVAVEGDAFAWRLMPPRAALADAVSRLEAARDAPFAPGYQSEINLNLAAFVHGLGDCITRGALLFVDYGMPQHTFYLPERDTGTLMCHYRHRAHADPFLYPGLQDITAHVDFTAVAEAGVAAGLELAGYTSQAYFLLGGGLEAIMRESDPAETRAHLELTRQIKLLTSPEEMGERFKVMMLARGLDTIPSGFALRDQAHLL
ncbi:MAG TPA: SAM-dependent methyltransferase [Gammaproteobacteria bacterium]|nr:SAM-dependent methyltransferase [Gammaproteobacteria bacterium]